MRTAFFGTSKHSRPILEALKNEFDLSLCVTKSDRIVGRSQKREPTKVKKWSRENKIKIFEVDNFKNKEEDLLEALTEQRVDLIIVADFGFIITDRIINAYQGKIVNIHFSLLPKYRGANPVQAAILNGDSITGITYLLMSKEMDAGDILHQIKHPLEGSETTESLYKDLFKIAAQNIPKVIKGYIGGEIEPKKQNPKDATYHFSPSHPKSTYVYKEDARIDWTEDPQNIDRKIRAFYPWPIAWTTLEELEKNSDNRLSEKIKLRENVNKDTTIKIYEAVLEKHGLSPTQVQVAGKSKIGWAEFKNGYCVNQ